VGFPNGGKWRYPMEGDGVVQRGEKHVGKTRPRHFQSKKKQPAGAEKAGKGGGQRKRWSGVTPGREIRNGGWLRGFKKGHEANVSGYWATAKKTGTAGGPEQKRENIRRLSGKSPPQAHLDHTAGTKKKEKAGG